MTVYTIEHIEEIAKIFEFREPIKGEPFSTYIMSLAEYIEEFDTKMAVQVLLGRTHDKFTEEEKRFTDYFIKLSESGIVFPYRIDMANKLAETKPDIANEISKILQTSSLTSNKIGEEEKNYKLTLVVEKNENELYTVFDHPENMIVDIPNFRKVAYKPLDREEILILGKIKDKVILENKIVVVWADPIKDYFEKSFIENYLKKDLGNMQISFE